MRRSFSVQKKSGGMQSDDGQRLYGEAAERRRADERREAESALMESLGRRPDRRVFILSKKKRRGETEKPPCQLPVCHRAREVVCSVTQSLISAQWEVVISSGSEPCALSKYPLGG